MPLGDRLQGVGRGQRVDVLVLARVRVRPGRVVRLRAPRRPPWWRSSAWTAVSASSDLQLANVADGLQQVDLVGRAQDREGLGVTLLEAASSCGAERLDLSCTARGARPTMDREPVVGQRQPPSRR